MGSEGSGGARASGVAGAKGCDTSRTLVFAVPKTERISSTVSQRGSEHNANSAVSSSGIRKSDTESSRNTFQLSAFPKEDMLHELCGGSISNSQALAAGHGLDGKHLQKKERRVPRPSPGCFKTPRTPQMDMSMSTADNMVLKDTFDDLVSHAVKSSHAEKSQPLKQKNNLNGKRGERRNPKIPLKKHDGLAAFSSSFGGNKVFGTYGLKADVHDITKLIEDISLDELLDGSYKCPSVGKEKGKRPANTSENILHSVRKCVSILQHRGLPLHNKQCDEIDLALSKEISSAPPSTESMSSNLDVDEESSLASDFSCSKVQESYVSAEAPLDTVDIPLYHPTEVIEKLALPLSKDLDSLLQDAAKLTFSRCNDPRPGKALSGRVTLSPFSWSYNHNGHSKSNADSVKVSSRTSCQGRWARIRNTSSFFGGSTSTQSFADLDSLTYDHSLVPSGSVKYILPITEHAASKVSSSIVSEQATTTVICSTSSASPPAPHSPRATNAAQVLFNIANSLVNPTANGIIKWPKQPSQKSMKARKLKSIQSSETLLTPKSELILDNNTVRFMEHTTPPFKKPKLLISEKRENSGHANAPKAPYFPSAPRSSRSSPTRAPDANNRHHVNGSFPKPMFKPPPRRVTEKSNHNHQKPRKVLQMDWNRGKSQM